MGDRACDREFCPECDLAVARTDDSCPECGAPIDRLDETWPER